LGTKNRTGNENVLSIAILGCGPAGLLAAHACARAGVEFNIYSVKRKSPISGAQYLHKPIPGIHNNQGPDGHIAYAKTGTREGYARKVYGNPDAPVSWDKFEEGLYAAWSMQQTYDFLWDEFSKDIEHITISPKFCADLVRVEDIVISSIPAPAICMSANHRFHQTTVYLRDGDPTYEEAPMDNSIIYNGVPNVPWYRASNLFGHRSVEFGNKVRGAQRGMKPTGHNCDCQPEVLRIGRFGRWERGVLAHDGFDRTVAYLEASA
jgi:hypothetical protein